MGALGRVRARCDDALEHLAIPLPDRMQDARARAPRRIDRRGRAPHDLMGHLHERGSDDGEIVHEVLLRGRTGQGVVGATPSRLSLAARAVLSTRAASPARFAAAGDCVPGGANKTCVRPACSVFAGIDHRDERVALDRRRTSLVDTRQLPVQGDEPRLDARCDHRQRRWLRGSEVDADVGELVEQRSRLTVPIRLGLLRPRAADEPGDDAADDDHCDQDEQPGVAVVVLVSRRSGDRRGRPCRVRRRCRVGRGGGGRCGRRWRRGRGWRRRRGLGRRCASSWSPARTPHLQPCRRPPLCRRRAVLERCAACARPYAT